MDYSKRKFLGWIALIILSLIPVYLLFAFGPAGGELYSYGSITHTLGEIFGLVGITMFALTFLLSTRIKWIEDIFGGLDKAYLVHGELGGTALIVILAHPIFLVLNFIPNDFVTAAVYLLPSSHWSVNFGIIALLGMIILIGITLFSKIKYHRWKFTHEFLGLIFLIAVLHMFLVRGDASRDLIFSGYYVYAGVVSFIGMSAFSYSLFIKDRIIKNAVYRIESITEKKDVFEIIIVPEHKPISYQSGQFVFVRFYNEKLSEEAHPFSIASKSNEHKMRIVVKKLGDYTLKMGHLNPGDKISVEGPYGRFHFRNYHNDNQVWIAAGIGITPFIGMAEDLEKENIKCDVQLYYTSKNEHEIIGGEIFERIQEKRKNFKFIPWDSSKRGRITALNVLSNIKAENIEKCKFLLCGSGPFKEDIIIGLINAGVKRNMIHEEAFDFR